MSHSGRIENPVWFAYHRDPAQSGYPVSSRCEARYSCKSLCPGSRRTTGTACRYVSRIFSDEFSRSQHRQALTDELVDKFLCQARMRLKPVFNNSLCRLLRVVDTTGTRTVKLQRSTRRSGHAALGRSKAAAADAELAPRRRRGHAARPATRNTR